MVCSRLEVDADRLHEAKGALDLACERLVALAGRRAGDELAVPRVDVRQVGEAALRERAQQVQRRGRLVVALHEPLGIGHACLGRRRVGVDDVTPKRRQLHAVDDLGRSAARLRELPGDPSHPHHGQRRRVREDRRHLQQHLEPLADRGGRDVVERLDAVSGLEQERASLADLAERREERPRLSGEDERRKSAKALTHGRERCLVRPRRLLRGRELPPGRRRPGRFGERHRLLSVEPRVLTTPERASRLDVRCCTEPHRSYPWTPLPWRYPVRVPASSFS